MVQTKDRKRQILLVDDDLAWLSLVDILAASSDLLLCNIAQDALLLLKQKTTIELVITDTNMPDIDGIELLSTIRSNNTWNKLPVIVLFTESSSRPNLTKRDILKAGATLVLSKDEFLIRIKAIMDPILGKKRH